jgi:murein L,D-transpeptidase YafK
MRRNVIIGLVLAVVAGTLFIVSRRMSVQKMRGVAQNVMVKILPPPGTTLPYAAPPSPDEWSKLDASQRLADAHRRLQPQLDSELSTRGLKLGDAAFIRIFKESDELELWLQPNPGEAFRLFRNYDIALYSGVLGPKTKEGDMQAPEGFYAFGKQQLNPASSYHLSFNIGYPNEFDLAHQRTGSLIMVHGSNVSIGCFAMTDPVIEEIYLIVEAALNNGQERVPVHVFPFRMTEERMAKASGEKSEWLDFWSNLKEGYNLFESRKLLPAFSVESGKYSFLP